MIKVTRCDDMVSGNRAVWVNPEHIIYVEHIVNGGIFGNCSIAMTQGYVGVLESPEEVLELIGRRRVSAGRSPWRDAYLGTL